MLVLDGASHADVADSQDFALDGDFLIRFKFNVNSGAAPWARVLENQEYNIDGGWHFSLRGSDPQGARRLGFQLGKNGGGGSRIDSDAALPPGEWVTVEVARQSGSISMRIDGVLQAETMIDSQAFTSQKLRIGATLGAAVNQIAGLLDSVLIIKGQAVAP